MLLDVGGEKGLGSEHIEHTMQAAGQEQLAWLTVFAFFPAAQFGQQADLRPGQADTQLIEKTSGHPGESDERADTGQIQE